MILKPDFLATRSRCVAMAMPADAVSALSGFFLSPADASALAFLSAAGLGGFGASAFWESALAFLSAAGSGGLGVSAFWEAVAESVSSDFFDVVGAGFSDFGEESVSVVSGLFAALSDFLAASDAGFGFSASFLGGVASGPSTEPSFATSLSRLSNNAFRSSARSSSLSTFRSLNSRSSPRSAHARVRGTMT